MGWRLEEAEVGMVEDGLVGEVVGRMRDEWGKEGKVEEAVVRRRMVWYRHSGDAFLSDRSGFA